MRRHSLIYMSRGTGMELFNVNEDNVEIIINSIPTLISGEDNKYLIKEEKIEFIIIYKIPLDPEEEDND